MRRSFRLGLLMMATAVGPGAAVHALDCCWSCQPGCGECRPLPPRGAVVTSIPAYIAPNMRLVEREDTDRRAPQQERDCNSSSRREPPDVSPPKTIEEQLADHQRQLVELDRRLTTLLEKIVQIEKIAVGENPAAKP